MNKKDFVNKVFMTKNYQATKALGRNFAKSLRMGDIVCLYGDLGSGKTTFVQGLAEGLGVERKIISPTFIIVRCYELQTQNPPLRPGFKGQAKLESLERFYHIDLYRVGGERDMESLGLEEILSDRQSIIAIEWAENLKSLIPVKRIDTKFFYRKDEVRKIVFSLTT